VVDLSARYILNKFILNLINKSKLTGVGAWKERAEECLHVVEQQEEVEGQLGGQLNQLADYDKSALEK
jgi:hypothetical protein